MAKIFVPCRQAMTVRKAQAFGDIVYLHDQSDPGKKASSLGLEPDRIFTEFARRLNTYEPGDMILLDGPLIYNAVAGSILACLTNRLKFLIWHQDGRKYKDRETSLLSVRSSRTKKRTRQPTVYMMIGRPHTYEAAEKYGALVVVPSSGAPKSKPIDPERTLELICPDLKTSFWNDSLMLSGDKLSNTLGSIVLSRRHGVVTYLIAHHGLKRYLARSVKYSRQRIRNIAKS